MLLSALCQVVLSSIQIPTAMLDSKSLETSLLEVVISSKNYGVSIRDLSDLTVQIIFDAWWTSINVGSNHPSAWNNTRPAS